MQVRVYYEDTDAAGVVYHSNYLKYCERARTEFLRERGLSVAHLAEIGQIFPVVNMEIEFRAPARHDDLLEIETSVLEVGQAKFKMRQIVINKESGKILIDLRVTLACVSKEMKPKRITEQIKQVLAIK